MEQRLNYYFYEYRIRNEFFLYSNIKELWTFKSIIFQNEIFVKESQHNRWLKYRTIKLICNNDWFIELNVTRDKIQYVQL